MPEVLKAPLVVEFPYTRSVGPVGAPSSPGCASGSSSASAPPTAGCSCRRPSTTPSHRRGRRRPRRGRLRRRRCTPGRGSRRPARTSPSTTRSRGPWSGSTAPTPRCCTPSTPPAPTPSHTGMRVRDPLARRAHRPITRHRVLRARRRRTGRPAAPDGAADERVTGIIAPVRLDYDLRRRRGRSPLTSQGSAEGRIIGERCPSCRKVYVPPRGAVPDLTASPPASEVEVGPRGTVTTFCVVNVPVVGPRHRDPLRLRPDPARRRQHHLASASSRGSPSTRCAWACGSKPCGPSELARPRPRSSTSGPTGEPDADYETYKDYL